MPRPFFETLRELRSGRTIEDLAAELAELIKAVRATGKGGSITLTLKLKPPKSGAISYLTMEDEITTKLPTLDRGSTVFFPTADNGLSRQDQTQQELPLRGVVDTATGEIKPTEGSQSNG